MEENLGQWLQKRCEEEHLSVREAAAKIGLSYATLYDIAKKGVHPRPETLKKLAKGFSRGTSERLALEDELLALAGYREREGEPVSEALATFIDKVRYFSDAQLKLILRFANFLIEIEQQ